MTTTTSGEFGTTDDFGTANDFGFAPPDPLLGPRPICVDDEARLRSKKCIYGTIYT